MHEVNIIECPDCKRNVLDNVNYCRFCRHDFNEVIEESSGRLSRFLKNPLKGAVSDNIRHCTSCGNDITDFSAQFCENCGALIPYQEIKIFCSCGSVMGSTYCNHCNNSGIKRRLNSEEFYQMWHNEVIIPLSKEYNKDLSNEEFKIYFNLTNEQYNHIIYKIIYSILFDKVEENLVEFFKLVLKETKSNYEYAEKAISNSFKEKITNMFNNEGISSSNTSTIKASYTETVETPHIQNKHGAGTKVLATAVAGPLGYVATSGVKQETTTKEIHHNGEYLHTKVIIARDNVSYLTYSDSNYNRFNDNRNDINKLIIDWKDIKTFDDENYFILHSGKTIKCPDWPLMELSRQIIMSTFGSIYESYNNKLIEKYWEIGRDLAKNTIINLINERIAMNKIEKTNTNSISDLEALEKIIGMYKQGLLTEDEFSSFKQKLLNDSVESSSKFCGNCGAEISDDSKFCMNCGTKINDN